jgi:hypothetical protein
MTDVHDKATRSKNMRAIGTRDTAIEKRLAGLLTQAGFDFACRMPRWRASRFRHRRVSVHHLYPRLLLASSRLLPV